ncbi:TBC1 domain family member 22A isoform X1 [Balaenoptera ricei]|uniref:TBC1 domain family member 22A isoform X1 n=1 Tax=Balaenoptera ricei TaxID=2746895 RepID=UPI0028BEE7E3|nr:TBC1 domain family member 22A isoform X1 [Balaenoptera ricei]
MASDGARKQFWKRSNSKVPGSIQHVYGAQHPPFDPLLHGTLLKATPKVPTTPVKAKRVSTFQEFESNTSDAWDAGEDDDELLAMAAESLNTAVVMETANRVLRNHSQRQGCHKLPGALGPEQKPKPSVEPPSVPSGDLRLVKSVSESRTSCPAGSASDAGPLQRSQSLPHSATVALGGVPESSTLSSSALSEREASRLDKFKQLLAGPNTDLEELRKLSWSGIPKPVRAITWKLLSGYLPANVDRRPATLQRKQKEYFAFIDHYYDSRTDEVHQDTYRQIHIDIPRMSPEALILQPKVTEIFERILFIWAIRHPASGYVQGINDLVTPFFVVFICEYIGQLHVCSTWDSNESENLGRTREPDRWASPPAPGPARGEVPAVRLPLDEQPADARGAPALHHPPVGHVPVGTRGLRAFPLVRVCCFSREMEERNTGRKRFSRAAALPPEPAHSPLGRRRHQPAAGRGLPPQVCLRGRPQSLQEMSPGPPPWPPPPRAAHPTAGRLKATAEERPCWSGWPGRGPGPGEGWRPLFSEIPKRAREGPGHAGPERGRASPSPDPGASLPSAHLVEPPAGAA